MRISKVRAEIFLMSLLWLVVGGSAISSCAPSGLSIVIPATTAPDISHRMMNDTPQHRGITLGGPGYFGHEIVAPADGVVVFVNYNDRRGHHIRILHDPDSKQGIYTEHFHVHGGSIKEGDRVKRGQTIGLIGLGNRARTDLPHYHYIVIKEENPGKPVVLHPIDYWLGIDAHKTKLEKGLDPGPFIIPCYDPNMSYPTEPIRFTYPAKCK